MNYRGGSRKTNIEGGLPKKGRGLRQFADLRGGLGKKEEVVFLRGVDTPMHTVLVVFPFDWLFI